MTRTLARLTRAMDKVCSKCNETKPLTEFHADKGKSDGRSSRCKVCARMVTMQWRAQNPGRNQEYLARWTAENEKRQKEYRRAYWQKYKDRGRVKSALYRANNAERVAQRARRWYEENSELTKGRAKTWRIKNKERYQELNRAKEHRRRARKASADGYHTAEDVRCQYKSQRGKCYYCAIKVGGDYHVDHVIPLSRGGSNGPENIVIACPDCNRSKGAKLPHEWVQSGRLL